MTRYKVCPATEHRKHSNRFEVWDTEREQCIGQYIGREQAQEIADRMNAGQVVDPYAQAKKWCKLDGKIAHDYCVRMGE